MEKGDAFLRLHRFTVPFMHEHARGMCEPPTKKHFVLALMEIVNFTANVERSKVIQYQITD